MPTIASHPWKRESNPRETSGLERKGSDGAKILESWTSLQTGLDDMDK